MPYERRAPTSRIRLAKRTVGGRSWFDTGGRRPHRPIGRGRGAMGIDFGGGLKPGSGFFEDTPRPDAPKPMQLTPAEEALLEDAAIEDAVDAEMLAADDRADQLRGMLPMLLVGVIVVGGAYYMWGR